MNQTEIKNLINMKNIIIVLLVLISFGAGVTSRYVTEPAKPVATSVFYGYSSNASKWIIDKVKQGYQVTHLAMSHTSGTYTTVVMSKY
jgi:hypothetical protein